MSNSKDSKKYGGDWTKEKLRIFEKYLNAYSKALKNQKFNIVYIDAFAGTGDVEENDDSNTMFPGSARIALSCEDQFDNYYLIDINKKNTEALEKMVDDEFSHIKHKVEILNGDSNKELIKIIDGTDWNKNRALLFLDPFATSVSWTTIEKIADTCSIDVWYLFPISALNRMLKVNGELQNSWVRKINDLLGCEDWQEDFYCINPQMTIDDFLDKPKERHRKNINIEGLKKYIVSRLSNIFPFVNPNSKIFKNSNNSALFLLCFAVSNHSSKAIGLAKKISNDILLQD